MKEINILPHTRSEPGTKSGEENVFQANFPKGVTARIRDTEQSSHLVACLPGPKTAD
jgi:hypothetical protein